MAQLGERRSLQASRSRLQLPQLRAHSHACRAATDQVLALMEERDRLADERDKLVPALEKERWQCRQLERRLGEAAEEGQAAAQVLPRASGLCLHCALEVPACIKLVCCCCSQARDALAAQLAEAQEAGEAAQEEARQAQAAWKEERAALKEQVKALNLSLGDAQDALALEAKEKARIEVRRWAHSSTCSHAAASAF